MPTSARLHHRAYASTPKRGSKTPAEPLTLTRTTQWATGALTQLPTPDCQQALTDMDRHIEPFPSHDPEAYRLRAWIHENLGNHAEADRDRKLAE